MILKKPKFWDNKKFNFLSILFLPLSIVLIFNNFLLNFRKNHEKSIISICVGNIYAGGTGKTPLAIEIYKILKKLKIKSVLIKKFYNEHIDEIKLLKNNGNLISSTSRKSSLQEAINKKYDVAILDDGLQDRSIKCNLNIVCFNKDIFIGNGKLIPAGPLREKITSLKKYDLVFLNGLKKNIFKIKSVIKKQKKNIKIFESTYQISNLKKLSKKKRYILFSGIGNPKSFEELMKMYKFKIIKTFEFPDHYNYNKKDISMLNQISKNLKANLLTTEKDYLRIKKIDKKNINFVSLRFKIHEENKLINYLENFYENN